jgi:hypothetical protein
MPLDPMIARGTEAPDLTRPLLLAEEIKNRRQTNQLYAMQQQFTQQKYADEQAQQQEAAQLAQTQAAEKEEASGLYHAAVQGNPMAKNLILKKISEKQPGIFQGIDVETAWKQIEPHMRQSLGVDAQKTGDNIGTYNPRDYTVPSWGKFLQTKDPSTLERYEEPQRPYAPVVIQSPGMGVGVYDRNNGNYNPLSTPQQESAAVAGRARQEATAKAGAERQAVVDKRIAGSTSMLDALDMATPLVLVATGSLAGAAADKVASVFGYTPSGAEATASLRILSAKVMENVPRMEGPQSDRDVQMYREAAGQLGEPTVTRAEKMAAIRTIRQLTTKYAARNAGSPGEPAAAPAPTGNLTPEEQRELDTLRARFKGKP